MGIFRNYKSIVKKKCNRWGNLYQEETLQSDLVTLQIGKRFQTAMATNQEIVVSWLITPRLTYFPIIPPKGNDLYQKEGGQKPE